MLQEAYGPEGIRRPIIF